jgi:uncharacterized protein
MRVWIDFSNSPHVRLFEPVVRAFRAKGWDVVLSARDHAQTLALASERWDDLAVVGGSSPSGRAAKGRAVLVRSRDLARFARSARPDVALSHGSYAQIVAARSLGIPAVTMMDYEHQPANHLSFRLATRVIVPDAFPAASLRSQGARAEKVVRYSGFKEELYLADFAPDPAVLSELGIDRDRLLAVFRPAPAGALYHRSANERFDHILEEAARREDVQVVLLPRWDAQADVYGALPSVRIPARAVDACSLMAAADLVIGAGGTMSREAALLGTPVYTVFSGKPAAVDSELIRLGLLHDLRATDAPPPLLRKRSASRRSVVAEHAAATIATVRDVVAELAAGTPRRRFPRLRPEQHRPEPLA